MGGINADGTTVTTTRLSSFKYTNGYISTFDFRHHEADVFSAFCSMMAEVRDGFIRELDKEASGIQGHIHHYDRVLKILDYEFWTVITKEAEVTH